MSEKENIDFVRLTNEDIENLFIPQLRQVVIPAPEGRFLLHVPDLNDGREPATTPNVKDMLVRPNRRAQRKR